MDKRSFALVASPLKVTTLDNRKKFKAGSVSPKKKANENNGNVLNAQVELNNELDGLCFEDDEEDFDFKVF